MSNKELREWINTIAIIVGIIIGIVGLFQIINISINLEKITAREVSANRVNILNENGVKTAQIYEKNGLLIVNSTVTEFGSLRFRSASGPCNLSLNHSVCTNETGTYIVG